VDETKLVISEYISNSISIKVRDIFWFNLFSINKMWVKFLTGEPLINVLVSLNFSGENYLQNVPKSYSGIVTSFKYFIFILQGNEKQYELSTVHKNSLTSFFSVELLILQAVAYRVFNRSDYEEHIRFLFSLKKSVYRNLEEVYIEYLFLAMELNNNNFISKSNTDRILKLFKDLAENSPSWFQGKYLHLLGLKTLENNIHSGINILEIAIEVSQSNNNLLDAAIISEDLGKYMTKMNNTLLANKFYKQSSLLYGKWGATTKAASLENK
jgi:hypothetical protein